MHATKNTPGHAHAISVPNRDVSRGSSPDTLFAKEADLLLPDTSSTHPHPAHPAQHTALTNSFAASTSPEVGCRLSFGVCTLPVRFITYAGWLLALAVRARRHILITYNDFWGLLALFIMATNKLKSSGATKCVTHITIIRSMMPVFPRPTHESFPFFPDYHGWN